MTGPTRPDSTWTLLGAFEGTTAWERAPLPAREVRVVQTAPGAFTFARSGVTEGSVQRTAEGYAMLLRDLSGTQRVGFYPRYISFMDDVQ